jgi:hypothetical protein
VKNGRFQWAAIFVVLLAWCGGLRGQPIILQQPTNALNQPLGSNVELCVIAEGAPGNTLTYQWLKNGVNIPSDGNTFLGVNNSCLTILDIQAVDGGLFSVLVGDTNSATISQSAEVTVVGNGIFIVNGTNSAANATPLPSLTQFIVRSSNAGLVKQSGTPNIIPNDPGGSEMWFRWTVPSTPAAGIMTFSTLGSDFDTTIGAYTLSAPSNKLIPVPNAINDDDGAGFLNSVLSLNAAPGTTCLIAVDGFYGAQGDVVLSGTFTAGAGPLPANAGTPLDLVLSNGATLVLQSPWPGNKCDWLFNQQILTNDQSTLIIPKMTSAQTGAYVASLTTSGNFTIHSEPILVQINLLQDGSTDTNSVIWNKFLNAVNDTFSQPGGMGHVVKLGDTGGYSVSQSSSISHGCVSQPHQPLLCTADSCCANWYSYTAPSAGTLEISTVSPTTQFSTILGVFLDAPLNGFGFPSTMVGCGACQNNIQPSVYVTPVAAGQNFCIMVQPESTVANGCASGSYNLNLYLASCDLNITRAASMVSVTWPLACGTNLQSSARPSGPWTPVTAAIVKGATGYSCGMPVAPGNLFFTLR